MGVRPMFNSRVFSSTIILALLMGCLGGGTAEPLLAQTADGSGDSDDPSAAPEGDAAAGAAGDPEGDVAPADWTEQVDAFFGNYMVAPLALVLFYSFGTEHWLGTKIPFVVVWLLAGAVFFTLRMGFINLRGFWHAIRLTKGDYDEPGQTGEVTHFQALSAALSATVGLGNIAGVAIAIGTGGPGATFWMIVVGLIGMSSKFTECTLGQMYRRVGADGTVSGGPMLYLREGLTELGLRPLGRILATIFAIMCIGASWGGGCAFQVGQSLTAIQSEIAWLRDPDPQAGTHGYPWIYGLVMAGLVALVIIGGIRAIGAVAGKIVPFMCSAYVLVSIYIIATHPDRILPSFQRIFEGAFSLEAGLGGFLGVMVIGVQRAVFSNEAGIGSAAIAHSAAKTEEPISEGIVALLEPFIDTVVVCTMTALVIIITGVWENPDYADLVRERKGAALTAAAFSHGGFAWFRWILYAAVVLFAYSTLISWSYYGERCWTRLFGERASILYKIIFLVFVVLGSVVTEGHVLDFSDLLILSMAFPNILGVVLLSGKVKRHLDDYWQRYQSGQLERTD